MSAQLKVVGSDKAGTMDREKALEAALAQIDRAFGKGSAMKLGSREAIQIESISTGSLRSSTVRTGSRCCAARAAPARTPRSSGSPTG